jgi:uncharacterized membrane protein YhaH (DUF805 family)
MSCANESVVPNLVKSDMEPYALTTAVSFTLIGVISILGSRAESTLNPRFKNTLNEEVTLSHVVFNSTVVGAVVLVAIVITLISFTNALYKRSVCVFGKRYIFATSLALSSSICGALSLGSMRVFDPGTPHHLALAMTAALTGSTSMWLCADNDPYLSSCAFMSTIGIVICASAPRFTNYPTIILAGETVICASVILYFIGVGLIGCRDPDLCEDELSVGTGGVTKGV